MKPHTLTLNMLTQALLGGDVLVPNKRLLTHPGLRQVFSLGLALPGKKTQAYLGWGQKDSGAWAKRKAQQHNVPCILVEEGFLISGRKGHAALQLLIDATGGVHYDPSQPSCIDAALETAKTPAPQNDAATLIELIRRHGLSKTNNRHDPDPLLLPNKPFILVCDQVENDASLAPSRATKERFALMLEMTRKTWPDHLIVIRRHPKANEGHFAHVSSDDSTLVLDGTDHPATWLKMADHVVVMSSQMGFEALIHGTPVTCWGTPFYAYRGLTRDFGAQPGYMRERVDLHTLVAAALVVAPTHFDINTGKLTTAETVAQTLMAHRKALTLPQSAQLKGFSARKTRHLQRFIPGFTPVEGQTETTLAWGNHKGTIRVEDGFIRSKGLGAAFAPPLSWIFDTLGGIHTDPTKPSLCESLLQSRTLTAYEKDRGKRIKERLIAEGVTKYNLTGDVPSIPENALLVLGQVEGDASLLHAPIKTNKALLEAVRVANPDATIIYRPHPDVVAQLRPGEMVDYGLANHIDTTSALPALLDKVASVHTNTSQGGLEALLRGKPVTCYGPAFYAGWGLTIDTMTFAKRTRTLDIDSLCFLLYDALPLYNDPKTKVAIDVFQAIDSLRTQSQTEVTPWRRRIARIADAKRRQNTPK